MRRAERREGAIVNAYVLGGGSSAEREMIDKGKIRLLPEGMYELFSREAVNGSGELASAGDYFKIDGGGFPYPNRRDFFISNHQRIGEDLYKQRATTVEAWTASDGMCEEIRHLIDERKLIIDENSEERYFSAPLFGTVESASRDAVIVFYDIMRDSDGKISDAIFNFVEIGEFNKTYRWV